MHLSPAPRASAPLPNHGPMTVGEVVARAPELHGGVVGVSGTYIHSTGSIFDEASVVTSMIPGPIKGAAALKVTGLDQALLDGLQRDRIAGTGERWGSLDLSGVVDASDGVATLHVRHAAVRPAETLPGPDDFGGLIED